MNCRSRNANEPVYNGMRAMTDPTLLEHSERMAKQEERMNTHQAKYEGALDRLRAEMAKREADMAKQDKDNLRWFVGMWIATNLILGAWIRWPF